MNFPDTPTLNQEVIGPGGQVYIWDGSKWVHAPSSAQPPTIGGNGNWFVNGIDTGIPAQGQTGPQGPQGIPGQGLIVLGQFNTAADLTTAHPTATEGDAYLVGVTDPKNLFLWFNNAWHDVGPLTGVGIGEAPNTPDQGYMRDGLTQGWTLVTHDGGSFP